MATFSQEDAAIDLCMDATDAYLEQHRNMCQRLKDAIFLMTRCRRDLNLSAMPVDMMIPQDLQPLLSIRAEYSTDGCGAVFYLEKSGEETKDTDPCQWFTSFPSQDLRRARSLFIDAVKFAVAAANSSTTINAALLQLPDE